MDEKEYEKAFEIITYAGNAKSSALMAIDAAADGDFERADALYAEAETDMSEAHKVQFAMTQAEASGSPIPLNIMLVHAEDHLTMAIMAIDFAKRFIQLYREKEAA